MAISPNTLRRLPLIMFMKSGDAGQVRDFARGLLRASDADEDDKAFAARALFWCGEFAEALPHLPESDHAVRAMACARLGQFNAAQKEIDLYDRYDRPKDFVSRFLVRGEQSRDPAEHLVCQAICLLEGAGVLNARWMPKASDKPVPPKQFHALLRDGHFEEGIAAYTREELSSWQTMSRLQRGPLPRWRGERVAHLLVVNHAGNGDFFQFGRYLPIARERCARVSVVVEAPLAAIAQRSLPVEVVVAGTELPILELADACTGVDLSLPAALGAQYANPMRIEPIDGSVPYIGSSEALHVGLCWSASPKASVVGNWGCRSIPFASLGPLNSLVAANFHSLQVGAFANDAEEWVRRHELRTWDDTVSLIAALDAVVTVDTSVAHLAASMGKPVHLILTEYEDWRWGTGETTPWYPTTMRVYRGDVDESVRRIGEALKRPSAGQPV